MSHFVVSVPHSGTRTLVRHLRFNDDPGVPGVSAKWLHFGMSNPAVRSLLKRPGIHAHIPVRNPMDVARSWARRKKAGDALGSLLGRYRMMFDWMAEHEGRFTLYRIEDLPRLAGTDEHPGTPSHSRKIAQFRNVVQANIVEPNMDFFLKFYDPETLNGPASQPAGPEAQQHRPAP